MKLLFWRPLIDDDGNNQCPMPHDAYSTTIQTHRKIELKFRRRFHFQCGHRIRYKLATCSEWLLCLWKRFSYIAFVDCLSIWVLSVPLDPSIRASEPIACAAQQKIFVIYRLNYLRFASHIRIIFVDQLTTVSFILLLIRRKLVHCSAGTARRAHNSAHRSNCLFEWIFEGKWMAGRMCLRVCCVAWILSMTRQ